MAISKKIVEYVMPIGTGHERGELVAFSSIFS